MNLYQTQFDKSLNFKNQKDVKKCLIIASTGRSGSHFLGHLLHQTKCFGFPLEYVNPSNLAEWKKRLQTNSTEETLKKLQTIRTSENGVFSIKLHYHHLALLGGFEKLEALFPNAHFILLTRKDALKQAISTAIASQTGVWISGQTPTSDETCFDAKQINFYLKQVLLDSTSWKYLLVNHSANFIEMEFESIRDNVSKAMSTIAQFMDVELETVDYTPKTKKQSNQLNKEWEKKYLQAGFTDELVPSGKLSVKEKLNTIVKVLTR